MFRYDCGDCIVDKAFPSPSGVWVVSSASGTGRTATTKSFRPLAGCGLFPCGQQNCWVDATWFPSPCGVWVVSMKKDENGEWITRFRPLAGCGLFRFRSPKASIISVSVPLRGVGCFGKAAHSFWCNRKKNCQLCCFIVSYWQMVYQ